MRLPVMISVTITDQSGRTLSGQTVEAFWTSIAHARPLAVGINCALGAERDAAVPRGARAHRRRAASAAIRTPACRTPSAATTRRPTTMARLLREFARAGWVNIVGGCCGTTPEHIRAIADAVRGPAAARVPALARAPDALQRPRDARRSAPTSNFMMIGERTNVTGSKRFAELIKDGDYDEALEVALEQVRGGANILDVNMDEGMLDGEAAMTTFLNLIADRARDRARPDHGRQLEVVGDRGGPQVRAGQGDRQLDQPEGRRGGVPRARRGWSAATARPSW